MELRNLFCVGVLYHKLDDTIADSIEEKITPYLEDLPLDGYYADHRHSDFFGSKINVPELFPELMTTMKAAFNQYSAQTFITINREVEYQYWVQDYHPGDSHGLHGHGTNGLSAVYWARANEHAGYLSFYNPNPLAEHVKNSNPDGFYTCCEFNVPVEKGVLLVFPSYLKHRVIIDNDKVVRTTIAVNISG
jgi:hypothetical protein